MHFKMIPNRLLKTDRSVVIMLAPAFIMMTIWGH